jgi:hypothetical protein
VDVTQELVSRTFPHGLKVLDMEAQRTYSLVDPEVGPGPEGKPMMLAWGEANKDFYFDLDKVTMEEDPTRWKLWCQNTQSSVYLKPLSEKRAASVQANLKRASS